MRIGENTEIEVLQNYLEVEDIPEIQKRNWGISMKSYTPERLYFLEEEYITGLNSMLKLPDEAIKALVKAALDIRLDDTLCRLVWHWHCLLFKDPESIYPWSFYFPRLMEDRKGLENLLNPIILLSGLGKTLEFYAGKGIPENIVLDTLSDFKLWVMDYYNKSGRWGLDGIYREQWFIFHFTGSLYSLGRLQYSFANFTGALKVYRNIKTNQTLAFSDRGITYRRDGLVDGTNGVYDAEGAWTSWFESNEKHIRGNIISPYGFAVQEPVELSVEDWKQVLAKGDRILSVHISSEGKLSPQACKESVDMAGEFFTQYFPEYEYSAIVVGGSWLFDSQYQKILPATSNIVQFQKEFYLFPIPGDDSGMFERVFGLEPEETQRAARKLCLEELPQTTSMQKAMMEFYLGGGCVHSGGGFILREDLNWGSQVYQKDISDPCRMP